MSRLQPLYVLRKRLQAAALAGMGLLEEDFRLRQAAENLQSLAAVSPVFGRLSASVTKLLEAEAADRAGLLLDALALAEAVVYAQGACGLTGDLADLPTGAGAVQNIPYSRLEPLLAALNGTGSGRTEIVRAAWEKQPEDFRDFRILSALLDGLEEKNVNLANLCAEILKKQDRALVPLLKWNLDPAGKRDMARRVEIIAALEGENASGWLQDLLPQAKGSVRASVIQSLGCGQENAGLLLDLAQIERGKYREAALAGLARVGGEAVAAFWREELARNREAIQFLKESDQTWVDDVAPYGFRVHLQNVLETGEPVPNAVHACLRFQYRRVMLGRTSSAALDFWRWAADQAPALEKIPSNWGGSFQIGKELAEWLLDSLCAAGPGPLCDLCRNLWEQNRSQFRWMPHALAAGLLDRPAAEVYETFAPYLTVRKAGMIGQAVASTLLQVFSRIRWNGEENCYEIFSAAPRGSDDLDLANPHCTLAQGLDLRWYDVLSAAKQSDALPREGYGWRTGEMMMDQVIRNLFRPDQLPVRERTMAYFAHLIRDTGKSFVIRDDIQLLAQCGWTQWKGFLAKRAQGKMTVQALILALDAMPLRGAEKAEELRSLGCGQNWPEDLVENQAAKWEAEV